MNKDELKFAKRDQIVGLATPLPRVPENIYYMQYKKAKCKQKGTETISLGIWEKRIWRISLFKRDKSGKILEIAK